jgi:hypothetical protein
VRCFSLRNQYLFRRGYGVRETRERIEDAEYARRLDELDRLLNDPDVPMEPTEVWSLLAEIAQTSISQRARAWFCLAPSAEM